MADDSGHAEGLFWDARLCSPWRRRSGETDLLPSRQPASRSSATVDMATLATGCRARPRIFFGPTPASRGTEIRPPARSTLRQGRRRRHRSRRCAPGRRSGSSAPDQERVPPGGDSGCDRRPSVRNWHGCPPTCPRSRRHATRGASFSRNWTWTNTGSESNGEPGSGIPLNPTRVKPPTMLNAGSREDRAEDREERRVGGVVPLTRQGETLPPLPQE